MDSTDRMSFDCVFEGVLDWSETSISRCTDLLTNGHHLVDVTFLVGRMGEHLERIPANKALLAEGSDVFRAMFFGPLAMGSEVDLSKDEEITVESFNAFFYTGEIDLSTDNILQIFHLAKKYICAQLAERCVAFWEAQVEVERSNILALLPVVGKHEELDIVFWNFVDANPKAVFSAPGFKDWCLEDLTQIIGRDALSVREVDVYIAASSWGKAALIREQKTVSHEIVRERLGDAFFLVRFTQMQKEEFEEIASKSEYLFEDEKKLFSGDIPAEIAARFESRPRTGTVPSARVAKDVSYLKRMRSLRLCPSQRVTKHGIDVNLEPNKSVYIGQLPRDMTPEAFAAFVEEYIDPSGVDVWNYIFFPRTEDSSRLSGSTWFRLRRIQLAGFGGAPRGSSKYGSFQQKYSRFRKGTGYRGRRHYDYDDSDYYGYHGCGYYDYYGYERHRYYDSDY
ncbi:BTB/POZ domain-containing protein 3-like protein [Aphelenchoides avenae]|nr:BTB/POZ domain-containing protein 3-like protein [Aphelenchus avenae]